MWISSQKCRQRQVAQETLLFLSMLWLCDLWGTSFHHLLSSFPLFSSPLIRNTFSVSNGKSNSSLFLIYFSLSFCPFTYSYSWASLSTRSSLKDSSSISFWNNVQVSCLCESHQPHKRKSEESQHTTILHLAKVELDSRTKRCRLWWLGLRKCIILASWKRYHPEG